MNIKKTLSMLFIGLFAVILSTSQALAFEGEPSATVTIETTSVAAGVGFTWGEGVLHYQGKDYKFKLKGLSVVDVGISSISATGKVYLLQRLEAFPGTFVAGEASAAVAAGAGVQSLENQHGVIIHLTSTQAGVKFKLAPEGIHIEFVN
ncbi:MAG: DUF1134 domain-containing protein [Nitrosomonas sp.]|nr:DUF1134 domain-containing protein [Nitrosomonas sp.]